MTEYKGMKYDTGKHKSHALPLELLWPLADLMTAGAIKYEKFNCLEPFDNWDERFWDSTLRHLEASQKDPLALDFRPGELDVGTGCFHLAAATFGCLMRLRNALLALPEMERVDLLRRYAAAREAAAIIADIEDVVNDD